MIANPMRILLSDRETLQVELVHHFATRASPAVTTIAVNSLPRVFIEVLRNLTVVDDTEAANDGTAIIRLEGCAPKDRIALRIGDEVIEGEVPGVPFDVDRLIASGPSAPFDRFGFGGRLDFSGPFFRLEAAACTCAFARVVVHNRTSDEKYWAEADVNGDVRIELSDTFPGDVLDLWADDIEGHRSTSDRRGFIVPAGAVADASFAATLRRGDVDAIVAALVAAPSATHRAVLEQALQSLAPLAQERIRAALDEVFRDANQVMLHLAPRTLR